LVSVRVSSWEGRATARFIGIKQKGTAMSINKIVPAIAGLAIAIGPQAPGFATEHEVLGLYVNSGDLNKLQVPPGAETTFDSTTVHCPRETCTLALSAMLEIHSADYQGDADDLYTRCAQRTPNSKRLDR
jgi:hypothetical protein